MQQGASIVPVWFGPFGGALSRWRVRRRNPVSSVPAHECRPRCWRSRWTTCFGSTPSGRASATSRTSPSKPRCARSRATTTCSRCSSCACVRACVRACALRVRDRLGFGSTGNSRTAETAAAASALAVLSAVIPLTTTTNNHPHHRGRCHHRRRCRRHHPPLPTPANRYEASRGNASDWFPYLQLLPPPDRVHLPVFFTERELLALQDSHIISAVRSQQVRVFFLRVAVLLSEVRL
jgi:hypothetical protein